LRWKKIRRWLPLESLRATSDASVSIEDAAIEEQRARLLRAAIAELPDELRRVVLLTEFSELRYDQIAEVLGIAPGTVASRRHRAVERLRLRLESLELTEVADEPRDARPIVV
jgi:RNA polymerase sigma-70 factor (ECF subfamily)